MSWPHYKDYRMGNGIGYLMMFLGFAWAFAVCSHLHVTRSPKTWAALHIIIIPLIGLAIAWYTSHVRTFLFFCFTFLLYLLQEYLTWGRHKKTDPTSQQTEQ